MKEHKAATRRGDLEQSAFAEHAWNYHHQMAWDDPGLPRSRKNKRGTTRENIRGKVPRLFLRVRGRPGYEARCIVGSAVNVEESIEKLIELQSLQMVNNILVHYDFYLQ